MNNKNFLQITLGYLKSIIVILLLICSVIFMVNNRSMVTLEFFPLPLKVESRLFLVMIISFLTGMVTATLFFAPHLISQAYNRLKKSQKIPKS